MKRLTWLVPVIFLLLQGIWISTEGCHQVVSPTFPPTKTLTPTATTSFTRTPTNTATLTGTPTNSPTPTITNTLTNTWNPATPSLTFTDTPTVTDTPTLTDTPTFTLSPTITLTPTITNTPSCAGVNFQATYTFETSTDCWSVVPANGGPASIIINYGLSTTQHHNGSSSFAVSIHNTTTSTQSINLVLNYAAAQNFGGATIVFNCYLDTTLAGCGAIQPAETNPGCGWDNAWKGSPGTGSWFPVTLLPSTAGCTGASIPASVMGLYLQLYSIPVGASGNFYVDDITITIPAGPTPTFTSSATPSTANSMYFDIGGIPSGWSSVPSNGAVTTSDLVLESPGYGGSVSCLGVTVTYSGINQVEELLYTYTTNTDWTSLGLSGFRAQVSCNPLLSNNAGGVLFVNGSGGWTQSAYTNISTAGTWVQLDLTLPVTYVATGVQQFGVQFQSGGGSSTWNTSTLYLDNVELY